LRPDAGPMQAWVQSAAEGGCHGTCGIHANLGSGQTDSGGEGKKIRRNPERADEDRTTDEDRARQMGRGRTLDGGLDAIRVHRVQR
jgi:hypothetical protein